MNFSFWIFYYPYYSVPATSPKDVNNVCTPRLADSAVNSQCADSTRIHQPSDGNDATDARHTKKDVKKSER